MSSIVVLNDLLDGNVWVFPQENSHSSTDLHESWYYSNHSPAHRESLQSHQSSPRNSFNNSHLLDSHVWVFPSEDSQDVQDENERVSVWASSEDVQDSEEAESSDVVPMPNVPEIEKEIKPVAPSRQKARKSIWSDSVMWQSTYVYNSTHSSPASVSNQDVFSPGKHVASSAPRVMLDGDVWVFPADDPLSISRPQPVVSTSGNSGLQSQEASKKVRRPSPTDMFDCNFWLMMDEASQCSVSEPVPADTNCSQRLRKSLTERYDHKMLDGDIWAFEQSGGVDRVSSTTSADEDLLPSQTCPSVTENKKANKIQAKYRRSVLFDGYYWAPVQEEDASVVTTSSLPRYPVNKGSTSSSSTAALFNRGGDACFDGNIWLFNEQL